MAFITGHSGAGKSTFLARCCSPSMPQREAAFSSAVPMWRGFRAAACRCIGSMWGAVFQDHRLLARRSVFENVALPLRVVGMRERDIARRVRAALSSVELLDKMNLPPRYLSVGEQQRVGIARAVVNRPRILLADEPTGQSRSGAVAEHHGTLPAVSPDRHHRAGGHARSRADRCLRGGRVVELGPRRVGRRQRCGRRSGP